MARRDYQDQGSADEPLQDVDEEEAVETAEEPPVQEEASPTPEANVSTPQSDASNRSTRQRFPWEADPTADVEDKS